MHIKCVVRGFFDCVFAVTHLYFAILSDDIGSMRIKDLFKWHDFLSFLFFYFFSSWNQIKIHCSIAILFIWRRFLVDFFNHLTWSSSVVIHWHSGLQFQQKKLIEMFSLKLYLWERCGEIVCAFFSKRTQSLSGSKHIREMKLDFSPPEAQHINSAACSNSGFKPGMNLIPDMGLSYEKLLVECSFRISVGNIHFVLFLAMIATREIHHISDPSLSSKVAFGTCIMKRKVYQIRCSLN